MRAIHDHAQLFHVLHEFLAFRRQRFAFVLGAGIILSLDLSNQAGRAAEEKLLSEATMAAAQIDRPGIDSSRSDSSTAERARQPPCSMTWVTLNLVVFNLAFYVSAMTKKKWTKVGIRVLGSWLIAISLLVLAFYFKKHRSVGG